MSCSLSTFLLMFILIVGYSAEAAMHDETYMSPDNRRCYLCNPGFFLIEHCKEENTTSICKPCPAGTFSNTSNQALSCGICRPHCESTLLVVTQECTATTNRECDCPAGSTLTNPKDKYRSKCKPDPVVVHEDIEVNISNVSDPFANNQSTGKLCVPRNETVTAKNITKTVTQKEPINDVFLGFVIGLTLLLLLNFVYLIRSRRSDATTTENNNIESPLLKRFCFNCRNTILKGNTNDENHIGNKNMEKRNPVPNELFQTTDCPTTVKTSETTYVLQRSLEPETSVHTFSGRSERLAEYEELLQKSLEPETSVHTFSRTEDNTVLYAMKDSKPKATPKKERSVMYWNGQHYEIFHLLSKNLFLGQWRCFLRQLYIVSELNKDDEGEKVLRIAEDRYPKETSEIILECLNKWKRSGGSPHHMCEVFIKGGFQEYNQLYQKIREDFPSVFPTQTV